MGDRSQVGEKWKSVWDGRIWKTEWVSILMKVAERGLEIGEWGERKIASGGCLSAASWLDLMRPSSSSLSSSSSWLSSTLREVVWALYNDRFLDKLQSVVVLVFLFPSSSFIFFFFILSTLENLRINHRWVKQRPVFIIYLWLCLHLRKSSLCLDNVHGMK